MHMDLETLGLMSRPYPWARDQIKGMEICGPIVQFKNHIHIPKSVQKYEGINPHTPKLTHP
jgi:hypothetical protein